MIFEAVLDFLFGLASFILGLFPSGGAPSWIADAAGYLDELMSKAAGLGAWLNLPLAGTVIASVLVCVVVGFTIKVVRMVASFFLGGGGSAA